MSLEIKHNDIAIYFSERDDEWTCNELGLRNKSLKRLKAEITKMDTLTRRVGSVRVIYIDYRDNHAAAITLIDKDKVWLKYDATLRGSEREKVGLADVIHDTPENRATLVEVRKLEKEASEISTKASKIKAAITRVTMAELRTIAGDLLDSEDAA